MDYSGKTVEFTPKYTGNLSIVYRHENGFMAQMGAQYASEIYWEAENANSRKDIITANAKIGYEAETFDIYLYSTNMFDERYATTYDKNVNMVIMAPPQEIGLQFTYRW